MSLAAVVRNTLLTVTLLGACGGSSDSKGAVAAQSIEYESGGKKLKATHAFAFWDADHLLRVVLAQQCPKIKLSCSDFQAGGKKMVKGYACGIDVRRRLGVELRVARGVKLTTGTYSALSRGRNRSERRQAMFSAPLRSHPDASYTESGSSTLHSIDANKVVLDFAFKISKADFKSSGKFTAQICGAQGLVKTPKALTNTASKIAPFRPTPRPEMAKLLTQLKIPEFTKAGRSSNAKMQRGKQPVWTLDWEELGPNDLNAKFTLNVGTQRAAAMHIRAVDLPMLRESDSSTSGKRLCFGKYKCRAGSMRIGRFSVYLKSTVYVTAAMLEAAIPAALIEKL